VGNGKPADEGRAGTISPTHPHNEPSLGGRRRKLNDKERKTKKTKKMLIKEVNKTERGMATGMPVDGRGFNVGVDTHWIGSEKTSN
jgi:hypothetical protein